MRRRNSLLIYLSFLVLISAIFLSCQEAGSPITGDKPPSQEENWVFEDTISTKELMDISQKYDASELQLKEVNFKIGEISGGYTLQSENLENEIRALQAKHQEVLKYIQHFSSSQNFKKEISRNLNLTYKISNLQIRTINVLATPKVSTEISKIFPFQRMTDHPKNYKTKSNFNSPAFLSNKHEDWAPYRGVSEVKRNSIFNLFYFNDTSRFGWSNSYEHETQVYDTNYANYGGYWSTNMPYAYKDTQFLDRNNIDNFTVGTAKACALREKEYYCYMSLEAQENIRPQVRIKGQLGYRILPLCYSTWCVFSDIGVKEGDTTDTMALFSAPSEGFEVWYY